MTPRMMLRLIRWGNYLTHPEKVVPKSTPTINLSAMGAKSLIGSLTGPLIASVDEGRA